MKEICHWSAKRLVKAMQTKQLSAVEVMKAHLDRIEKVNPLINGLADHFPREMCLKMAEEADARHHESKVKKLHGLPVTIKDGHLVKGLVSCAGCVGLKKGAAEEDSTVVARLKQEGALVIGLTNVPEMLASYETDNAVYGRTNNPYDLSKTPGGSSGGCAALLAVGGTPLSIGSDAGGSLRWPAHCTGITTHKPTIGLVPRTGSVMGKARGLMSLFATSGPMARYVEDLILTLPILAGPDGIDPYIAPVPLQDPADVDLSSLRIAYIIEDDVSEISAEIAEAVTLAINALKSQVTCVEHVTINCLKETNRLLSDEFYLGSDRGEGMKHQLSQLGVTTPSQLMQKFLAQAASSSLSVTQFRHLFREIDLYKMEMLSTLKPYDILLSPVAATPAKPHGSTHDENKDMSHCMMHSLTGWPTTIIRCGTSACGLPLGLQIAAKPWHDHVSLRLALHLESLLGPFPSCHLLAPHLDMA